MVGQVIVDAWDIMLRKLSVSFNCVDFKCITSGRLSGVSCDGGFHVRKKNPRKDYLRDLMGFEPMPKLTCPDSNQCAKSVCVLTSIYELLAFHLF